MSNCQPVQGNLYSWQCDNSYCTLYGAWSECEWSNYWLLVIGLRVSVSGIQHVHWWRICIHHHHADRSPAGVLPWRHRVCHLPLPAMVSHCDVIAVVVVTVALVWVMVAAAAAAAAVAVSSHIRHHLSENVMNCRYSVCLLTYHNSQLTTCNLQVTLLHLQ